MHPKVLAQSRPDHPAVIDSDTGRSISFAEMDAASNRFAQLLRSHGLQSGDVIALMIENCPEFFNLTWGAQRAGLFYVCISTRLTQAEIDYILADSGAKLFVASASLGATASAAQFSGVRYSLGGTIPGFASVEDAMAAQPDAPIADERAGMDMLYSSGTTGRPKGIKGTLPEDDAIDAPNTLVMIAGAFGIGPDTIYLTPAPMYHAAPLRWSMTAQRLGATVVLMPHFDAEKTLAAIERYKVTAGQFVPTHFVRMLKLPEEVRAKYDLSSLKLAIHAAAPCPVPVKRAMIEWWGPVINEYYAGSEGNGLTWVTAPQWLEKPGTVGKAIHGILHICDEDGNELPARSEGLVYFEGGTEFQYHNDPEKTQQARNRHGWTTLGDIGWVDEDGFLYLTDRKSFMIISGGVNIYPQEIENHLVTHPKVTDVAVIGGPHEEMGEEVIAIIQPADMGEAGDDLAAELTAYCRTALSGVKTPRRIDFREELPRHPTGKLYKRLLRDEYWAKAKEG
ncbi:MAG: acyl-CoA synthetase [Sphingopyxis sp.]|nr:acyl-CoA synthetase [Sphingopyxis sp.]